MEIAHLLHSATRSITVTFHRSPSLASTRWVVMKLRHLSIHENAIRHLHASAGERTKALGTLPSIGYRYNARRPCVKSIAGTLQTIADSWRKCIPLSRQVVAA
jgi:hypothetical protein